MQAKVQHRMLLDGHGDKYNSSAKGNKNNYANGLYAGLLCRYREAQQPLPFGNINNIFFF